MHQNSTIPYSAPENLPTEQSPPPKPSRSRDGWKGIASTVLILIAAPLVALFLTSFVFQSYEVDGPSMETTLQNRDRLIVWKLPLSFAHFRGKSYQPTRGDIVIFVKRGITEPGSPAGEKQLIKRVIAVPGERVVVQDGVMTVYNSEHPEGFNPDSLGDHGSLVQPTPGTVDITVAPGEVFVCGDNRSNSLDSRTFGSISTDDIVGELAFRIFPFNKFKNF